MPDFEIIFTRFVCRRLYGLLHVHEDQRPLLRESIQAGKMLLKAVKEEEHAVNDALENNTLRDNMDTVDTQQIRRDRRDALLQLGDSYLQEHNPGK